MPRLVSYARSWFWTVGVIEILASILLGFIAVFRHKPSIHARGIIFTVVFLLLNTALGVISCLAARALRRKTRFARTLVATNSLFSLAIFPFGTVAGAVGLYWCWSKKMRETEPPVEDFERQSKPEDATHAWVQKAVPIVSVIVLIGSLVAANLWAHAHGLVKRLPVNGLLLLILCDWIAVFCHELGHTLAGGAVGMTLSSFRVGPFVAEKRKGQWKFQFSLVGLLNEGGAMTSNPLYPGNLRKRMAFEIAGGPLASLLTAVVAFAALLAMPGSAWVAWWQIPALIAAISASGALLNIIPFGFAAGYSDGAALLQLLRGGRFADLRESMKMLGSTFVSSTRPRDLDAHVLESGVRAATGTPQESGLRIIQMVCAMDRGELEQARKHLEAGLDRMSGPEKAPSAGYAAEMAYFIAYLDGNASRARLWLRGAEEMAVLRKTPLQEESDYWRALTAIRKAEGSSRESEDAYTRAMELLSKKPSTGLYEFERELLQKVRKGDWVHSQEEVLSEVAV